MLIPKKNRKEVYKYLFKGEWTQICSPCSVLLAFVSLCAWLFAPRDYGVAASIGTVSCNTGIDDLWR